MQAFSKFNHGVKYLLAVIDVLSKYGWLVPLKDKTGKYVASALKTIFKERKPEKMWVDKGKEFYNKDVKDLVELYSTENTESVLILEKDYQVDFNHQNSISKVLGFTGAKYTEGFHESENVVDILRINSILINIDIISGSYVNGTTKNTIYSFFPKVSPGYKIIESPVNLVYLPITLDTIDSLNVTITDQDDHLLNLRNEKLTIRFHIREAR